MDLAKYRAIFIEESAEHFGEISNALLDLEKDPANAAAIDIIFRMAHSIKGMAASLEYDAITTLSHRLEDRMQMVRAAGCVAPGEELGLLFRGLSALEVMVESVREAEEIQPPDPELMADLARENVPESPDTSSPVSAAPEVVSGSPAAAPTAPAADVVAPRPPPTVRVGTGTIDRFLSTVGEVILNSSQVRTSAMSENPAKGATFEEDLDRMDRTVGELQRGALALRTTQVRRIVEPLPRTAREIAQRAGKRVEVQIEGAELELDRSILDRLSDSLVHLVRNAVDHGIERPEVRAAEGKPETGRLEIAAIRQKDSIRISVSDDGSGVDLDSVRARAVEAGVVHGDLADDLPPDAIAALVFEPGLSTAGSVSEISGRGVGMDAVRTTIESLGGSVELASERGRGTTTSIVVPITAAVQRVLLLAAGAETVALPITRVERILDVPESCIERSGGDVFTLIDDDPVPVLDLVRHVGSEPGPPSGSVSLVLISLRGATVALSVDRVVGQQQIYVKPVPSLLSGLRPLAGLTILGDGRPMFLLDLNQIS